MLELLSLIFLGYATVGLFLSGLAFHRTWFYLKAKNIGAGCCIGLLPLSLLAAVFDNIRLFLGGFHENEQIGHASLNQTLEIMLIPPVFVHQLVLPLLILIFNEFAYNLKEPKYPKAAKGIRICFMMVALFLTSCGAYNFVIWLIQGRPVEPKVLLGILTFGAPKNFGFILGRIGPHSACIFGLLVGLCIWVRAKRPTFFFIILAVLIGLACGAFNDIYGFFSANFWEIIFFVAIFLEERKILGRNNGKKNIEEFQTLMNV